MYAVFSSNLSRRLDNEGHTKQNKTKQNKTKPNQINVIDICHWNHMTLSDSLSNFSDNLILAVEFKIQYIIYEEMSSHFFLID